MEKTDDKLKKLDEKILRLKTQKRKLERATTEQARKRRNHLLILIASRLCEGFTNLDQLEAIAEAENFSGWKKFFATWLGDFFRRRGSSSDSPKT